MIVENPQAKSVALTAPPRALTAKAWLIRGVEQRLLELFSEGKLFGTVHTCIGQEWTGVAVAETLVDGDVIFTNHRGHGHFLARTGDVNGLMAELMGRQSGVCGGRGGSQHLCAGGVYSNGIQGGIVPVAAGMALAHKLRGNGNIAVVFIGDGTLGEGAVYETLNIASNWDLPLLVVVENNRYSQSTSQAQTLSGAIEGRARAFGIESDHSETWTPTDLLETAAKAVAAVRDDGRPRLLRIDTDRLMAHSKGDDDRDPETVRSYWERDPLVRSAADDPEEAAALQAEARDTINAAVTLAEKSPYAGPGSGDDDEPTPVFWKPASVETPDRVVTLIYNAMRRNMLKESRIVLLGEDIEGPYGGAFKVTKDLSIEFPGRVRNMPISESAIAGLGNGLALLGMVPVCEIMFGDFLTLAADQFINHASKFRYMYNDQVELKLIVRTPMGGKRGYGPTHSQSLEKHFLGLPGTRVLAINHRHDPGVLYDTLFATIDRPTLVIENKTLYGTKAAATAPEGFALEFSDETFPTVRIRPQGVEPDLTILCYGGMLADVEKAIDPLFDGHEIVAEVICPAQLYPFNLTPVLESVRRSGRLLIVEEGHAFAAFGAEVIAKLAELEPGALRKVRRLASPNHPIPSCGPLEKALLPGPSHVEAAALELCS